METKWINMIERMDKYTEDKMDESKHLGDKRVKICKYMIGLSTLPLVVLFVLVKKLDRKSYNFYVD